MNLEQMSLADVRKVLPAFLAAYISDEDAMARSSAATTELVSAATDEQLQQMIRSLSNIGSEHHTYWSDPFGRLLTRHWAKNVVLEPKIEGAHHLHEASTRAPTVIVCNHLSYFDANATDAVLAWNDLGAVADRLVFAAGPKVYQDVFRRVAAVCLNTLPVPQSSTLSHTDRIPPRELARRALSSLRAAKAFSADGQILLIYPEGSRSRSGHMGSFLRAVHRWLAVADNALVVPAAISGTELIMPVAELEKLHPNKVTLQFAAPIEVGKGSKIALEEAWHGVAQMLPEHLQPLPGTAAVS